MSQFAATAQVATPKGRNYAIQLCKHFGHKLDARFEHEIGQITFPFGAAVLTPGDGVLKLDCAAESLESLGLAKYVVETHLLRFAFREELPPLAWSGPETPIPAAALERKGDTAD